MTRPVPKEPMTTREKRHAALVVAWRYLDTYRDAGAPVDLKRADTGVLAQDVARKTGTDVPLGLIDSALFMIKALPRHDTKHAHDWIGKICVRCGDRR